MSKRIRVIQPASRQAQPARQIEPARLPNDVLYALFAVAVSATDGFPIGQWICVTLPDLTILKLPATGYQPVWRLVSLIPQAESATLDDLKEVLTLTHKIMSADRQSRQ